MSEQPARKFGANNGRVVGAVALVLGAVTIVLMLVDGIGHSGFTAVAGVALIMACIWVVMIRPSVFQRGDDLILRQAFSDISIPLAAIDYVTIRLFMVVAVGEQAYHSSAFGRSRRQVVQRDAGKAPTDGNSHADVVEETINKLCDNARAEKRPSEPITRTPAWLEIAVIAVLVVAVVVSIAL